MADYASLPPIVPPALPCPTYFQEFKSSIYAASTFGGAFLASIGISQVTSINDTVKWVFSKVIPLDMPSHDFQEAFFKAVLEKKIKIEKFPEKHEFKDWLMKVENREIIKNIFSLELTSLTKLPEEIHLLPNLRVIKLLLDQDLTIYPTNTLAVFNELPNLKILDLSETKLTKDHLLCLKKHPNPDLKININMNTLDSSSEA